jgi:hypothetical protein
VDAESVYSVVMGVVATVIVALAAYIAMSPGAAVTRWASGILFSSKVDSLEHTRYTHPQVCADFNINV